MFSDKKRPVVTYTYDWLKKIVLNFFSRFACGLLQLWKMKTPFFGIKNILKKVHTYVMYGFYIEKNRFELPRKYNILIYEKKLTSSIQDATFSFWSFFMDSEFEWSTLVRFFIFLIFVEIDFFFDRWYLNYFSSILFSRIFWEYVNIGISWSLFCYITTGHFV